MSLLSKEEDIAAVSDYYLSELVFTWSQTNVGLGIKTRPVSTLFKHKSARELYDKVSKYVLEEIFNSAYFSPIVDRLDISTDLEKNKKTVFLLPNHSYSIDEGSYESFKIEYLPLTSMGPKHSPDSIVIANLEHASWWWGNTKISQGALLNEREIALVRQWKLYDSSPVIF
jgi:hypothetical protein